MEIIEKIERNKIKANLFWKNKKKIFIKDINKNFYFCNIKNIDDEGITIVNFTGNMAGKPQKLYWADILFLDKYHEKIPFDYDSIAYADPINQNGRGENG